MGADRANESGKKEIIYTYLLQKPRLFILTHHAVTRVYKKRNNKESKSVIDNNENNSS